MSWEKSRFSNVMWFLYVLTTGWALLRMARMIASSIPEESSYGGALLALEIALVTGSVVFLIYRFRSRHLEAGRDDLSFSLIGQSIVAALILGAGLVFRITRMSEAGELASYFEMAKVAEGQHVPQLAHGASHIYVQLLHAVLLFIGNKFVAGVWLQIILQCGAVLLLYFAVRKLVGALAATISLAYLMFSGYMIQEALNLSPRMLYLLLFALGLFVISLGSREELKPLWFLGKGILIGILGFLDAGGFLLLFFMGASIRADWKEEPDVKQKFAALGIGLAGTAAGFAVMILADALLSGVPASELFDVWKTVYYSERFQVPVHQGWDGFGLVSILLLVTLAIGVFSYWCDKDSERLSVWVLTFCGALIAGVFGVFTDAIPGDIYLYLITVALAGLGVDECFRKNDKLVPATVIPVMTEEVIPSQAGVSTTPRSDEIWEPVSGTKSDDTSRSVPVPPVDEKSSESITDKNITDKPAAETQSGFVKPAAIVEEDAVENITAKSDRGLQSISDKAAVDRSNESGGWKPMIAAPAKPAVVQEDEEEEEVWGSPSKPSKEAARPAVETVEANKVPDTPVPEKKPETKFIDNPLPLPKPHQKRTMTFDKELAGGDDDYDLQVSPNDDFDIK